LQRACEIGGRRPNLTDNTMNAYARRLERELDRLLELEPANAEGRHLRDAIIVDARDKLLVFMRRRDVEPTNNGSEQKLRPSVIFRKITNCFRSEWEGQVLRRSLLHCGNWPSSRPKPSRRDPRRSDGAAQPATF
jgi:transposase